MKLFENTKISFLVLTALMGITGQGCNKKCKTLKSTQTGEIVSAYDFKDCYIYAKLDSNLAIESDSAFSEYKKSHFINCKPGDLESIDFSKNMLLGYKIKVNACNVAFHRIVSIDTMKKEYVYNVETEKCGGCGTELTGTNFVVAPKLPAGYKLIFSNTTRE